MRTDTLIIGGGLCGLSVARQLADQGRDFQLVEARERLGGRILSRTLNGSAFDLGPAWFWPGQQRMETLTDSLKLTRFEQYAEGILTYEDEQGQVSRGRGFASMEGSCRLTGGLGALIAKLAALLPKGRLHLETPVTHLTKTIDGVSAKTGTGMTIEARRVVLALPPRLASEFAFEPALSAAAHQTMDNTATWMAGQAKAVAIYEESFWRRAGLSGDAMSRCGPMVEIHDASPAVNGPYALFGFIGAPPQARQDAAALRRAITTQLTRLFGPDAADPIDLFVKDWAFDPNTSTKADQLPLRSHPSYGMPQALRDIWQERLIFSGTETAGTFGGYLEGALEAAENALNLLEQEEA